MYEGEIVNGVINGQGILQRTTQQSYSGLFQDGLLHGQGTFYVENGTYSLEHTYNEGEPEYRANTYTTVVTSPPEESEEPVKGKGKPPAKGAPAQEESTGKNEMKVNIDVTNPDEEKRKLGIDMKVFF